MTLDNTLQDQRCTTARQVASLLFQKAFAFTQKWTPRLSMQRNNPRPARRPRLTPKPDDITVWAGRISYLRSPPQDTNNNEGDASGQVNGIPCQNFQPHPMHPERLILKTLTERRGPVTNDSKRSGPREKGFSAGWQFSYV